MTIVPAASVLSGYMLRFCDHPNLTVATSHGKLLKYMLAHDAVLHLVDISDYLQTLVSFSKFIQTAVT